jgi:putative hydrolase of the HAD superfamily
MLISNVYFRHSNISLMRHIKNIIFDLGGVIINLDINKSIKAFNAVSTQPFEEIYTQAKQSDLFNSFDKGTISQETFFYELAKTIGYNGEMDVLYNAWNAMLLDFPEHRFDTLVSAKQRYNTFLLSNTNETHIEVFERDLRRTHGIQNFEDYFDKLYYSCRLGMRKPDAEIFEFVLNENKLNPTETIFIDDSIQHVKGAGEVGINAHLLEKNMEVQTLLEKLNLL